MAAVSGQTEIVVTQNVDQLASDAARQIVSAAKFAIQTRGRFTLVLSGGSTPERLFKLLAEDKWKSQIDWSKTWLFFGDERCVPHDDPRSNFRLANDSLLKPAKIDPTHVLAIRTELANPAACSKEYESQLRQFFGDAKSGSAASNSLNNEGFPVFDFVMLGLGDDGHTASLFPGKPTLDETKAWITSSPPGVLPPPVDRVTFTFPLLNAARLVMFLVAGANKADIVHEVLEGPIDIHKHPSTGVKPSAGKLIWMLDEEAAAKLDPKTRGKPNR